MKETHIDLARISARCDVAMGPEGGRKTVIYVANAKGRSVLKQISRENFTDDVWSEPAPDDWRCAIIRHSNRESPREIALSLAGEATVRGCRAMVRTHPNGEFELVDLHRLLAVVPAAGRA